MEKRLHLLKCDNGAASGLASARPRGRVSCVRVGARACVYQVLSKNAGEFYASGVLSRPR
jgi:hypothetical protein